MYANVVKNTPLSKKNIIMNFVTLDGILSDSLAGRYISITNHLPDHTIKSVEQIPVKFYQNI
jgi:hypothetical protein